MPRPSLRRITITTFALDALCLVGLIPMTREDFHAPGMQVGDTNQDAIHSSMHR